MDGKNTKAPGALLDSRRLVPKGCLLGLQAQKNRPEPVDLVQMERLELSRLVGTNT